MGRSRPPRTSTEQRTTRSGWGELKRKENAIPLELWPAQCRLYQTGARRGNRRAGEIPPGVQGRNKGDTPEIYRRFTGDIPEVHRNNTVTTPWQPASFTLEWRSRHAPGSAV